MATSIPRIGVLALLALLAACGGSDDNRPVDTVIVFGDSVSDVGSYASATPTPDGKPARGKFTTNPGAVWPETVAAQFGYTITAAEVGFGAGPYVPCPAKVGCTGYAQGGSRTTDPIGISHTDAAGNPALGTRPVKSQIDLHLASAGTFQPRDLVFIFVGPNDIFAQFLAILGARAAPGATPQSIAVAEAAAHAALVQAGAETADHADRVKNAGAGHVYVLNSINVGKLPLAPLFDPPGQQGSSAALLTALSQSFNKGLADRLALQRVAAKTIDIYTFTSEQDLNPTKYGLPATINVTGLACDATKMPADVISVALYCSGATLVAPNADMTYLWADIAHPTTIGHKAYADLVIARLRADGLL